MPPSSPLQPSPVPSISFYHFSLLSMFSFDDCLLPFRCSMTASRALYMGQAYRSVSRSRTGGDISVYTTDHPCSKDLAISARTLPQMPSPPASTNQPARTFETDETRPDSTAGQDSSNSVSAGGSSQHTQPKYDGSRVARGWKALSPKPMSFQEAERVLGMGCGDYWK
jgi:hypothetical protein